MFLKIRKSTPLVGLHRIYISDIVRGGQKRHFVDCRQTGERPLLGISCEVFVAFDLPEARLEGKSPHLFRSGRSRAHGPKHGMRSKLPRSGVGGGSCNACRPLLTAQGVDNVLRPPVLAFG